MPSGCGMRRRTRTRKRKRKRRRWLWMQGVRVDRESPTHDCPTDQLRQPANGPTNQLANWMTS